MRALVSSVVVFLAVPTLALAAPTPLPGRWIMSGDFYGTPIYETFSLTRQGDAVGGSFFGGKVTGAVHGDVLNFTTADGNGGSTEVTATLLGDTLTGSAVQTEVSNDTHPSRFTFTAKPVPARPTAPPRRHEFTPTKFYRTFSPFTAPVLTVSPGDTVHTTTVDAGGADEKGVNRVLGGNPQTGPFYVASAVPGDTLVVHILKLKPNRDYAVSDDFMVERAMNRGLAIKQRDTGQQVIWHLDLARGVASLKTPGPHSAGFSIPIRPMLGCVATATSPGRPPPPTGDSGSFGGNMDFNEISQGATLYLPVSVPGALLYLGDAHAAQGDGELTGNALETSMDVEFSVEVIPAHYIGSPRVESARQIMAMGLDGSIDGAFKQATANMASWLADEYGLTPSEIAAVLGSSAEYKVSEAADRNAGVVLKLDKDRLAGLSKASAK